MGHVIYMWSSDFIAFYSPLRLFIIINELANAKKYLSYRQTGKDHMSLRIYPAYLPRLVKAFAACTHD